MLLTIKQLLPSEATVPELLQVFLAKIITNDSLVALEHLVRFSLCSRQMSEFSFTSCQFVFHNTNFNINILKDRFMQLEDYIP